MAAIKKKLPPKLTPQYKESQKLLALKVDSLANELGMTQWCLMDTSVRCQVQATLAQAAAQADLAIHAYAITRAQDKIAESLVSLDHRLAGRSGHPGYRTEGALEKIHNALEKIAKEIERG